MSDLKNTALYKHLKEKTNEEQRKHLNIEKRAEEAAALLKTVRDTFPTYTLHDEKHVLNVIDLMGKIMGDELPRLTALESAILILSAYYHDVGMVFSEEQRDSIQDEPEFDKFLRENTYANLQLEEFRKKDIRNQGKVPEDIAEWYCRWIHPDRSYRYVTNLDDIEWNGPINEEIALVCKSHGYPIDKVLKEWDMKTDFDEGADLLFCSILLRLADIMDFDNSRSPLQIYQYLGLSKKKNKRDEVSNKEWRKHYSSQGFIFNKSKSGPYSLKFKATPDEPAIEYDIREFLKMIEEELRFCKEVLKSCSEDKKNFNLPVEIDKTEIKSKGYHYGEFKFTLEQNQILDLLMGENLYSDPYTFIRELAQNAIDTTRHREIYEKNKGNLSFQPQPITFSTWNDPDGYTWIRIDDYGMGMDEDILMNFFLKIGKSYYRSPEFQLEQIAWKEKLDTDFMPISRFGIGILSCFMMCDQIELSTRRVTNVPERNAIRLSMRDLNGFFMMKKEADDHKCPDMPNQDKKSENYRGKNQFGTSISARLNPKNETADFDLKETLSKYISMPPVPIELDGEGIGGDYHTFIEQKWCEYKEYPIREADIRAIEESCGIKFSKPPVLVQVPLDLTANSPSENFKGQGVIFYFKMSNEDEELFRKIPENIHFKVEIIKNTTGVIVIKADYITACRISCDEMNKRLLHIIKQTDSLSMSHNGIRVMKINCYNDYHPSITQFRINNPIYGIGFYNLTFKDNLRFDLSLSRDKLKKINWNIYSIIEYTFLKTVSKIESNLLFLNWEITELFNNINFSLKDILEDPLMDSIWKSIPIFFMEEENKYKSVIELRESSLTKKVFVKTRRYYGLFHNISVSNYCQMALIQIGLNVEFETNNQKIRVIDNSIPAIHEGQKYYPLLFFIKYDTNQQLRNGDYPINSEHPFSIWLINNTENLQAKYSALLEKIKHLLSSKFSWWWVEESDKEKDTIIKGINSILDRLRALNYEDMPPKSIYLKKEDFVFDRKKP
ncbi:MAG: hypothetical protein LBO74_17680 [Candidatus Symbiothrix sp.]|jgi:hypothetical protein|nr:hypothetical protein [Candidatus Symbiothrix sp.]